MTSELLFAYVRLPEQNFIQEPTINNLNAFKFLRAKTWKIIKEAKKKSWQNCQPTWFLHQNKPYLDGDEENIRKKPTNCSQTPNKNKMEATSKKDRADTLAETISANSSINNSNPHFLTFKNNEEKQRLNFKSNNSKKYNQPFTPAELQDEIHYEFLKHVPQNSLDYLLTIFNDIWINSKFPESWKIATIIPIPKQRRDCSNPVNYRPIALTASAKQRSVWPTKDWSVFSSSTNLSPILNVDSESGDRHSILLENWKPP